MIARLLREIPVASEEPPGPYGTHYPIDRDDLVLAELRASLALLGPYELASEWRLP